MALAATAIYADKCRKTPKLSDWHLRGVSCEWLRSGMKSYRGAVGGKVTSERIILEKIETPQFEVQLWQDEWRSGIGSTRCLDGHRLDFALTRRPYARARFLGAANELPFEPLGEIFFVPAGRPFQAVARRGRQTSIVCQWKEGPLAERLASVASRVQLPQNAAFDIRAGSIRRTLLNIRRELLVGGTESDTMVTALVSQLTVELVRFFEGMQACERLSGRLTSQMLDRSERPTIKGIARELQVSDRRLRRLLAEEGKPAASLLRLAVFERAQALLSESTMSIKQVAHAVGYATPSAFSAAFLKMVGVTPREYRAAHRSL